MRLEHNSAFAARNSPNEWHDQLSRCYGPHQQAAHERSHLQVLRLMLLAQDYTEISGVDVTSMTVSAGICGLLIFGIVLMVFLGNEVD